jgi:hypothetical protein
MRGSVRRCTVASSFRPWQNAPVDVEPLFAALTRLPPRSLQVLLARFVAASAGAEPGRDAAGFARFYGVQLPAAEVLLWRAAVDFEALLAHRPLPAPRPFPDEQAAARQLAQALEDDASTSAPELASLARALRALSAHAPAIRERLTAAERAELESPAFVRETWMRRAAIVIVLVLSGWAYFKADLVRWWRQQTLPSTQGPAGR